MGRRAKGQRPIYLGDPQIDKLLTIVLALASEVSVLRERLDTIERLMHSKGLITNDDIETYEPDEQVAQEREQWRTDYIARLFRVIEEEIDSLK